MSFVNDDVQYRTVVTWRLRLWNTLILTSGYISLRPLLLPLAYVFNLCHWWMATFTISDGCRYRLSSVWRLSLIPYVNLWWSVSSFLNAVFETVSLQGDASSYCIGGDWRYLLPTFCMNGDWQSLLTTHCLCDVCRYLSCNYFVYLNRQLMFAHSRTCPLTIIVTDFSLFWEVVSALSVLLHVIISLTVTYGQFRRSLVAITYIITGVLYRCDGLQALVIPILISILDPALSSLV